MFEPPDVTDTSSPCRSNFQRQWQRLLWGGEHDKGSTELPLWSVARDGLLQKANTTLKVQMSLQRGVSLLTEGTPGHQGAKNIPCCWKKIHQVVLVGSEQPGQQISVFPLPFPSWNSLIWLYDSQCSVWMFGFPAYRLFTHWPVTGQRRALTYAEDWAKLLEANEKENKLICWHSTLIRSNQEKEQC